MTRNVRIQFLQRYSLSKDGRLYNGDQEINWYILGQDIVCAIIPSNGKYPQTYKLQDLYLKSWGARPHMSIVNRIKKELCVVDKKEDENFVLTDSRGIKIELGSLAYATKYLKTSADNLRRAVRNGYAIKGFVVKSY